MASINKIWKDEDRGFFTTIFLLWMITLPFGSNLGGISLGFFTIYPSFVLLLLLFLRFIWTFQKWNIGLKSYTFFLIFWVFYAVSSLYWAETIGIEEWKFDVKSLIMQLLTVSTLFGAFYFFGKDKFFQLFNSGLVAFLIVLIIAGYYEFYTGNHILGHFTDKMMSENEVRPFFYAPSFVYDNPNDFLVYYNIVLAILTFQYRKGRHRAWLLLIAVFTGIIFGLYADARLMLVTDIILLIWILIRTFIDYFDSLKSFRYWMIPLSLILMTIVYVKSEKFFGPKYVEGNYTTEGIYEVFPLPDTSVNSIDVRKNLLSNGMDMIAEQPLTGVGAGQFRYRHAEKLVNKDTGTVQGPHNFTVEVLSQYGIIGWLLFIFLFVAFAGTFSRFWSAKRNYYHLLILFVIYPLFSLTPSSFLYMDINWIFLSFLIIYSFAMPFEKE